nr:securin cut2 [Schizosaccharomyces pombe]P21135.1 RecName: Full=Securin; AltName: Full=Cell untimely torn protein 2; Short=Protein Cut2 [Schizosaccharomyces pombe 972h-]AAA35299.1 cut2+ gene product [Schizosaccharomyces pombe]CAB43487.2 securin, sister chromatid separation inhibitor [Schizosaccharomyces pombe]|eukprot:NP_595904.2 securin cut2 [Schizosaccharomyces pombe]
MLPRTMFSYGKENAFPVTPISNRNGTKGAGSKRAPLGSTKQSNAPSSVTVPRTVLGGKSTNISKFISAPSTKKMSPMDISMDSPTILEPNSQGISRSAVQERSKRLSASPRRSSLTDTPLPNELEEDIEYMPPPVHLDPIQSLGFDDVAIDCETLDPWPSMQNKATSVTIRNTPASDFHVYKEFSDDDPIQFPLLSVDGDSPLTEKDTNLTTPATLKASDQQRKVLEKPSVSKQSSSRTRLSTVYRTKLASGKSIPRPLSHKLTRPRVTASGNSRRRPLSRSIHSLSSSRIDFSSLDTGLL